MKLAVYIVLLGTIAALVSLWLTLGWVYAADVAFALWVLWLVSSEAIPHSPSSAPRADGEG